MNNLLQSTRARLRMPPCITRQRTGRPLPERPPTLPAGLANML